MRNTECGVYQIRNIINGKRYIGSAVDLDRRWNEHVNRLNRSGHHNKYLQNAWNKYGSSSFVFEVIELCPIDQRFYIEQDFIDDLHPEYNGRDIADGGNGMKDRKFSDEFRKKLSLAHIGKPQSEKMKRNLSLAITGKKRPPRSEEHKRKLGLAGIGRKQSQEEKDKRGNSIREFWKTHKKIMSLDARKKMSENNWKRQKKLEREQSQKMNAIKDGEKK